MHPLPVLLSDNPLVINLYNYFVSDITQKASCEILLTEVKSFLEQYPLSQNEKEYIQIGLCKVDLINLENTFRFPESYDFVQKFEFSLEFHNFLVVVKDIISNNIPSYLNFKGSERQASPPYGANNEHLGIPLIGH